KKVVGDDNRIQEDNVLIEYDINPHKEFDTFNDNLNRGIAACYELAKPLGMSIAEGICSHVFTEAEIKSFHESALVFGCEPDYNALTGMRNPKPAAADLGLRTCGGHIHIGYNDVIEVTGDNQKILGVMCDYFLGLPSLLLDKDDRRRELYGKAGACRFKDYGIEYRSLSNFWTFQEKQRQWAWEQAHKAFNFMNSGDFEMLIAIVDPEEVQRCINEGNKELAEVYIKQLEVQ
ncbi:putative amidoligase domain-containing protein, partial [Herbiconiux daphne]